MQKYCCKCGTGDYNVPMITFYTNKLIYVDRCLSAELCDLWLRGIETMGCCCGHERGCEFIQVTQECDQSMVDLGYERLPDMFGDNCFIPKTKFERGEYLDEVMARELPCDGGDAR